MSNMTTFPLTCLGLLFSGLAISFEPLFAAKISQVTLASAGSGSFSVQNRKDSTFISQRDTDVFGVGPIFDGIESPLRTLNLKKFEGSWYEIASTKKMNAPLCLCATQSYKVESPSEIKVLKSCRQNIPDADEVNVGRAVVPDPYVPGAWVVSFREPAAFTNFFVVELDPDYQIAVVTGINGFPVIVLSRTPEIPVVKLASIRGVLANQGYDLTLFSETIQQGCWSSAGFRR